MLQFPMLGWLLLGVAAALRPADEKLPVFMLNSAPSYNPSAVFDSDSASNVVSYFLGEGYDSSSESGSHVTKYVESPLMLDSQSAVVIVSNLDSSLAESKFGSPHFFMESDSLPSLTSSSRVSTISKLASDVKSASNAVLVDAYKGNSDYNNQILDILMNRSDGGRIMLIGAPGVQNNKAHKREVSSSKKFEVNAENKTMPYIKIPAFFETEEQCVSLTNDCSNQGACVKSGNGMYACKCTPTVEDGYTYYWGGNDCSKRDVSTQFNLLVGTTLAIVVAGALSVKLLFNLGSEPLPGVLNTSTL